MTFDSIFFESGVRILNFEATAPIITTTARIKICEMIIPVSIIKGNSD